MAFWRHLGALLRKNYLLKRRSPVSTFLEILIPVAIALLLAGVKSIIPPDVSPVTAFTQYGRDISTVPSIRDAPLLLQAQRKKLAIVGPPSLVDPFVSWLNRTYPSVDGRSFGGGFNNSRLRAIRIPGMADVITTALRTEEELVAWLRSAEYPGSDPFPSSPAAKGRVWAAVVLQQGAPAWKYSIRMNASEVPSTRPPYIDTLDRQGVRFHLWKYLYANPVATSDTPLGGQTFGDGSDLTTRAVPGFMALQQTLDKYILDMPMRVSSLTLNDYSSKLGNAYWPVLGQDSNILWDDVWDGDNSRGINKTAMIEDMVGYGQAERYYPHEAAIAPFPTSAYTSQPFYTASQYSAPLIFTLALLVPIAGLIKGIVLEKEIKLRESMRMMGLSDASLQAAWLLTAEVELLLVALLVALILSFPLAGGGDSSKAMFPGSGFLPVFSLFSLFGTASVAYASFISTLFSSSRTASTVGSLLYFGAFFPFYATGTTDSLVSREGKVAACLLPPTCFAQSLSHLMALEGAGSTLVLYGPGANAHVPLRNFAFTDGLAMLAASVLGFALLAAYTDAVLPYPLRQYGTPRPWHFPLSDLAHALSACCGCRQGAGARGAPVLSTAAADSQGAQGAANCLDSFRNPLCAPGQPHAAPSQSASTLISTGSSGGKGGQHRPRADSGTGACEPPDAYLLARAAAGECIELQDIAKVFPRADGSSHRAVDGMSLTLYSGHISVLLGHNGAGKSTLINILAGLVPSSGGTLRAWGRELGGDFQALRADMGICPQADVLWPQLTAQEHIELFAAIKGVQLGPTGVQEALEEVGLLGKATAAAATLSGGQKRKLSLAIALLGRSKLLLLDEPTSGMDPYSRRSTWDLLQKVKAGRVIILTTHFMDEADILGDRIAIMAAGKLHSAGTPIYLKNAFGVGYNLTAVMPPDDATQPGPGQGTLSSSAPAVHAAVVASLPSAVRTSTAGREMHYSLPLCAAPSFPLLLRALDSLRSTSTGTGTGAGRVLESYSLGVTTMEDVFLQVAQHGAQHGPAAPTSGAAGDKAKADGGVDKGMVNDKLTAVAPSSGKGGMTGELTHLPAPSYSSSFGAQLRALLIKRALYARRDARGMCLQLLLPVVTVVLGLALLQVGKWLAGDQPSLALRPHFNTDPAAPLGPSIYPNRVPALNYKATDLGGVENAELTSLLSALSSVDPMAWDSRGPGLTLPPSLMDTLPDTYGLRAGVGATDGPSNNGWPGYAFASMSALLIARQECVLRQGRAYSALLAQDPTGALVDRIAGVRDGGSVYGALLFMLNGTQYGGWQPKHDVTATWWSGYADMLNVSHGWGMADGPSLVSWNNQDSATQPVLAYGLLVNVTAIHAAPILANQVHNALYRLKLSMDASAAALAALPACAGQGATAGCPLNITQVTQQASGAAAVSSLGSISVAAHPLPYTVREEASTSALFSFGAAAIVTIAFAFIPAAHAVYVAKERECGAKQQQELSGLSIPAYWASNYLYDVSFYLLPAAACLGAAWGFRLKEFTGSDSSRDAAFIGLVLLYGLAAPPFAYLLSFAFKASSSAQSGVLFLSISAVLLIIGTMIMGQLPTTCEAEGRLRYALMILPGYSLGNGLVRLSFLSVQPVIDAMCVVHLEPSADYASLAKKTYTATQGTVAGWNMLALGVQAVVYSLLVLLVDMHRAGVLQWRVCLPAAPVQSLTSRPAPLDEEEDVREERTRVEGMVAQSGKSSHPILLHRLRKVYSAAPKEAQAGAAAAVGVACLPSCCCRPRVKRVQVAAVKDLSFHVPAGEVFGFLGVNGAGKTTTMQVLTGSERPSLGQAWLQGHDVVRERGKLRRQLGYCPQTDPLVELLTTREHLELYARLKGLPEPSVHSLVPALMAGMELSPFEHTLAGSLSGGNKRKLSVAMALIGSPPILFLDEPSTGMDPVAKRVVWKAVRQAVTGGGAACMLTTHSMEESEALATRIGIMVAGELRCLGTASTLKSKLGQGYQLQLQLAAPSDSDTAAVAAAVRECLGLLPDSSSVPDPLLYEAQVASAVSALLGPSDVGEALAALSKGGGPRAGGKGSTAPLQPVARDTQPVAIPTATVHPTPSARKLLSSAGGAVSAGGAAGTLAPAIPLSALAAWLALERAVQGAVQVFTLGRPAAWCPAQAVAIAEKAASASVCFAGGHVLERHGLSLRLHVPLRPEVPLADLFAACEAWKGVAGVLSYGLSEATLEQVFNTFAGGAGTAGPAVVGPGHGGTGGSEHSPTSRTPVGRGVRRASLA